MQLQCKVCKDKVTRNMSMKHMKMFKKFVGFKSYNFPDIIDYGVKLWTITVHFYHFEINSMVK